MRRGSRQLLCSMLSVVITIGAVLLVCSTLIHATLCSRMYMSQFVATDKINSYCHEVYNKRILLLAENSNIPIRVFDVAYGIDGYSESALDRFFNGNDTEIYTNDRIETYEAMIKEYLEGTEQVYDEAAVHNTAVKAAEIYSDCFGLKNIDSLRLFVNNAKSNYSRLSSFALLMIFVPVLLIFALFTTKKKALDYYCMAGASTGFALIFVSVICLIAGVGKSFSITPEIYQNAVFLAINIMLAAALLIGVAIATASIVLAYKTVRKRAKNND